MTFRTCFFPQIIPEIVDIFLQAPPAASQPPRFGYGDPTHGGVGETEDGTIYHVHPNLMYPTTIFGEWIFGHSSIVLNLIRTFSRILHNSCALLTHNGPLSSDSKR
jgi:hypothetical protein